MTYTGTLLKIDGTAIPYIQEYKIQRSKLWKDAERNMEGDVRATLIGIFPKISIKVGYTTQPQVAEITQLLDKAKFSVEYFDARTETTYISDYYASDYSVGLIDKSRGLYEPFTVNLIPISARRY